MRTFTLKVTVSDKNAEEMREYMERLATQDVRVSPLEFARRRGMNVQIDFEESGHE